MTERSVLGAGLAYLRELGWEDVYRLPPGEAAAAHEAAAVPPGETARVAHEAAPAPGWAPTSAVGEAAAPLAAGARGAELRALAAEAQGCRACTLCERRTQVVFGSGNPDADLMLVGEGPGEQEDRQGLPFVGAAGALLTKILAAIGLSRDQVFIANVVKCRPPGNREPLPDEILACHRFLVRQIALVQPRVIVALGRVAAQTLLESEQGLGKLRGVWHRVQGVETRVTYHPAALLRNAAYKRPTWEDMQVVRDRLREPSTQPKPE